MGDPRRIRKKYQGPRHPWNKERIEEEKVLLRDYGLANKKELWKVQSKLTAFKNNIKRLIPLSSEQSSVEREQIFSRLHRLGLVGSSASADDVLTLSVENLLDRRLQTIVFKKGFARSIRQARQFITHGHVVLGDRKLTSPGYLVSLAEESLIGFRPSSSLAKDDHPERFSPEPEVSAEPSKETKGSKKKSEVEKESVASSKVVSSEDSVVEAVEEIASSGNSDSEVDVESDVESDDGSAKSSDGDNQ